VSGTGVVVVGEKGFEWKAVRPMSPRQWHCVRFGKHRVAATGGSTSSPMRAVQWVSAEAEPPIRSSVPPMRPVAQAHP
jgi:hypothetical protein